MSALTSSATGEPPPIGATQAIGLAQGPLLARAANGYHLLQKQQQQQHNESTLRLLANGSASSSSADGLTDMMMVGAVHQLPCFKDLVAVLFESFLIITVGYLSCRFKLISPQAKDLNSYLTSFALPMIIFLNIAQMEFQTINLSFLFCMLLAKLLAFTIVTILTLTISYPKNFGYAGALSILVTQSNDFALGYPLIKSLYADAKQHEMLNYLSLMAPIQLLILNPLGIIMLEYHKSAKAAKVVPTRDVDMDQDHDQNQNQDNNQASQQIASDLQVQNPYSIGQHACNTIRRFHNNQTGRLQVSSRLNKRPTRNECPQHGLDGRSINHSQTSATSSPVVRRRRFNKLFNRDQSAPTQIEAPHGGKIQPVTTSNVGGFRNRNIGSLALAMPARNVSPESCSEEDEDGPTQLPLQAPDGNYGVKLTDYGVQVAQVHPRYDLPSLTGGGRLVYQQNELHPSNVNFLPADSRSNSPALNQASCYAPTPPPSPMLQTPMQTASLAGLTPAALVLNSTTTTQPKATNTSRAQSVLNLNFLKALATNPLIIASIVALVVNLTHGPELPRFVTRVSNTIAASFAAPSLFVVGLSMYGKFKLILRNPRDLLLSSALVLTKVFLLPNLMRTMALLMLPKYTAPEAVNSLVDFSFMYGLLPTAPTACIIAKQYSILSNVVSISMVLSTCISAPLILAASAIINPSTVIHPSDFESLTSQTMKVSSVITLTLATLSLIAFWKSNRKLSSANLRFANRLESACRRVKKIKRNPTHVFIFLLAISQTMVGTGGLIWYFVDTSTLEPVSLEHLRATTYNSDHVIVSSASAANSQATDTFDADVKHHSEPTESVPLLTPVDPAPEQSTFLSVSSEGLEHLLTSSPLTVSQTEAPTQPSNEPWQSTTIHHIHHDGIGFKALCSIQYVFASIGLIMARIIILCLIITIAASRFRGHLFASRVSVLLVKTCAGLTVFIIPWLIYESTDHLKHYPAEPSLPSRTRSLLVRLVYDILFLSLAAPLFALIIKSDNKRLVEDELDRSSPETDVGGPSFVKRRFLTSSASLSSDSSSALTTNTNLESLSCNVGTQMSLDINNNSAISCNQPNLNSSGSLSIVMDGKQSAELQLKQRSSSPPNNGEVDIAGAFGALNYGSNSGLSEPRVEGRVNGLDGCVSNGSGLNSSRTQQNLASESVDELVGVCQNSTPTDGCVLAAARADHNNNLNQLHSSEFNKSSVLILFMLINSTIYLTSIAQKLIQNEPFGTFGQVEITNVALDFGQGLVTFLVYGMRGLVN